MSKSMIPATALRSPPSLGGDLGLIGSVAQAPARIFATLIAWQMRARERTRLARMEAHRLDDMGLTREQAQHEAAKPFWRA